MVYFRGGEVIPIRIQIINNKQKRAVYQSCALLYFLLLYTCRYKHTEFFLFNSKESICRYKYLSPH